MSMLLTQPFPHACCACCACCARCAGGQQANIHLELEKEQKKGKKAAAGEKEKGGGGGGKGGAGGGGGKKGEGGGGKEGAGEGGAEGGEAEAEPLDPEQQVGGVGRWAVGWAGEWAGGSASEWIGRHIMRARGSWKPGYGVLARSKLASAAGRGAGARPSGAPLPAEHACAARSKVAQACMRRLFAGRAVFWCRR